MEIGIFSWYLIGMIANIYSVKMITKFALDNIDEYADEEAQLIKNSIDMYGYDIHFNILWLFMLLIYPITLLSFLLYFASDIIDKIFK